MDEDADDAPSVPQRGSAFSFMIVCAIAIIVIWAVVSDLQLQFD